MSEETSNMHSEQEEWIQKYHDQIDKMTKLEEMHKVNMDEAQNNYDWLEKKYIDQDWALVQYKKEVGELKSAVAVAEADAFWNNSTLEQQKWEI